MLNLILNDNISVTRSSVADLDCHVSWADWSAGSVTPSRTNTQFSTAATGNILAGPTGSVVRNAKYINIRNKHASLSNDVTVNFDMNGTLITLFKGTLKAGDQLEFVEGIGWFIVSVASATTLMKILTADDTGGQNVLTAQPWFPTAGGVTVTADTTYIVDALLAISRAAGTTSHTTGILFAGTATLTSIQYEADSEVGEADSLLPLSRVISRVATNTTVKAASTTATEQASIRLNGIVRINAAGTFIPQFIYSAAPGGAPTIKANSYFRMTPVGNGSFASQGVWA